MNTYEPRITLGNDSSIKNKKISSIYYRENQKIDFNNPTPDLNSIDSKELRKKILSLTTIEARRQGINKSTLWYLQQRAHSQRPLYLYKKIGDIINE